MTARTVKQLAEDTSTWTLDEDVDLSLIFVDKTYARGMNKGWAEHLAETWNPKAVGVLLLSLRPSGMYACLDGWHRVTAGRLRNVTKLPAKVYIDLTPTEEAELFVIFNKDRRKMSTNEIFKGKLAAGDPQTVALNQAVHQVGLSVAFSHNKEKDHSAIVAVSALENIFKYGAEHLQLVLVTLLEAWGATDETFSQWSLRGLSAFLIRYHKVVDRARLITILRRNSPQDIRVSMLRVQQAFSGVDFASAWGQALMSKYNRGTRNPLPDWQAKVQTEASKEAARERIKTLATPAGVKARQAKMFSIGDKVRVKPDALSAYKGQSGIVLSKDKNYRISFPDGTVRVLQKGQLEKV